MSDSPAPILRLRSAFISDIHLGTRGCRAELLLEFLQRVRVDVLYLLGDVIDVWSLRRMVFWPQAHSDVVRAVLGKARQGTRVVYVPGNHDELFRELEGSVFGNLEVRRECIHETADERRLLVLHGDEFDGVVKCSRWLARLGTLGYDLLLWLNRHVNNVRRMLGFPHWSLVSYLKHKSRNAVLYIANFEQAVAYAAARRGVDGVICGHIHRPALKKLHGVLYCNDGDWIESCSCVVEDLNGRLSLWNWAEQRERLLSVLERAA